MSSRKADKIRDVSHVPEQSRGVGRLANVTVVDRVKAVYIVSG